MKQGKFEIEVFGTTHYSIVFNYPLGTQAIGGMDKFDLQDLYQLLGEVLNKQI